MTPLPLPPSDWARIARHIAGDESPAEAAATSAWLAADPRRATAARDARAVWDRTRDLDVAARAQADVRHAQQDAGWQRMQERMRAHAAASAPDRAAPAAPRPAPSVEGRPRLRHAAPRWRTPLALAASAVLVLVGLRTWRAPTDRFTAPPGQRLTVFLADGTRADLHPGSRLVVRMPAPRWRQRLGLAGSATRHVTLTGEAAFTVRHDPARPFRVEAGPLVAEDLGTIFGVRAYPDERTARVVVVEGEVAVRGTTGETSATPVHLTPGQVADVVAAGTVAVSRVEDPAATLGWTRDRLVFRRVPAGEVAVALSRWYGRPVVVADDALAAVRVTLDHPLTAIDGAVAAVAAALGATTRARGDTILITRP